MNSKQKRRAWRHERRQNEREILEATGAVIRSAIPVSLFAAGFRKVREDCYHVIK